MPTVTVEGDVTLQQAATALHDKLGSRYEVTTHGSGAQQALKVKQSAASTATVHLDHDGNTTTFHVHGGVPRAWTRPGPRWRPTTSAR
jgi:hypothetical protein